MGGWTKRWGWFRKIRERRELKLEGTMWLHELKGCFWGKADLPGRLEAPSASENTSLVNRPARDSKRAWPRDAASLLRHIQSLIQGICGSSSTPLMISNTPLNFCYHSCYSSYTSSSIIKYGSFCSAFHGDQI